MFLWPKSPKTWRHKFLNTVLPKFRVFLMHIKLHIITNFSTLSHILLFAFWKTINTNSLSVWGDRIQTCFPLSAVWVLFLLIISFPIIWLTCSDSKVQLCFAAKHSLVLSFLLAFLLVAMFHICWVVTQKAYVLLRKTEAFSRCFIQAFFYKLLTICYKLFYLTQSESLEFAVHAWLHQRLIQNEQRSLPCRNGAVWEGNRLLFSNCMVSSRSTW